MFLQSFTLPIEYEEVLLKERAAYNGGPFGYIDNPYPCFLFKQKDLDHISFDRVTILYGGNGSGKSTLLNLIAQKLKLDRIAPFNSSEMFKSYVNLCRYDMCEGEFGEMVLPSQSRIITSDDIFDYMLALRTNNDEISSNKEEARTDWASLKYGKTVRFESMEDYEMLKMQNLARNKSSSRRKFIKDVAGHESRLNSNGETAMRYFENSLEDDTLYCLDEPENSMSPAMQLKLVNLLEDTARYCGCQFIIATHSPFLLAMDGAKIYDLDSNPVEIKNWWELENAKTYYEFFKKHAGLFEK